MIANRSQISDIFGVAKTTVDSWVQRGCPVIDQPGKGKPSSYDTADVHKWLLNGATGDELDLQAERAKLAVEQTREKKRNNDIEENLVAPIEILSEVLASVCSQIASTLNSLPLTLKKQCPALTARDIDYIKKEIAKCRNLAASTSIDAAGNTQ